MCVCSYLKNVTQRIVNFAKKEKRKEKLTKRTVLTGKKNMMMFIYIGNYNHTVVLGNNENKNKIK